jgi:hypothetical protein
MHGQVRQWSWRKEGWGVGVRKMGRRSTTNQSGGNNLKRRVIRLNSSSIGGGDNITMRQEHD